MPKNTKQSQRINARKQKRLEKAAQSSTTEQRASKRQVSTAGISLIKGLVEMCKPYELSSSQKYKTYALMMMDDAVWSGFDSRATAIERAQANGRIKYKKSSEKSERAKDFLEYCIKSMYNQTTRSVGRSCAEMVKNGGAPHEMVLWKRQGEYSDHWSLKKLAYIDPATLDTAKPFVTTDSGDEILSLRQSGRAFTDIDGVANVNITKSLSGYVDIDWRKIAMSAYSSTSATPLGSSPLDAAYTPWREKQFLQETMLIGVTRDFSGVPVLRIPSEVIEAAESDPSSSEAAQLATLTRNMEMMHTADATYVVLPSDSQSESGTGLRDYDMEFKGIEGSGKQFNIEDIIEQKKRAIYNVLSAQHLITGENGGGSMNLHEGQAGMAALISDRDNMIVDEMWNKQVFPLLLRINGYTDLAHDEIPVWSHGNVQPLSHEEKGKYLQRVMRIIPAVPDVVNNIMEDLDLDYRVPDEYTPDQVREMVFDFKEESKVGTSEGTSGQGSNAQMNSDTNADNAA